MVALACGRCGRPCDLRSGRASVLFHAPSGDGGALCSPECSAALRATHTELVPMLEPSEHLERAWSALSTARKALNKAASEASTAVGMPLLQLGALAVGVRVTDLAAGQRNAIVLAEAGVAARPLQQALLHLLALGATGAPLGSTLSEIAGCNVDGLSIEVDVAGDQCEAMANRVGAAMTVLSKLRRDG